jgi:hypothetical protein
MDASATRGRLAAALLAGLVLAPGTPAGGLYANPAARGVAWLEARQNPDGSWGASEAVRPLYTSEAVRALAAGQARGPAYFAGVTWLAGQAAPSVDHAARRMLGLAAHGDDLGAALDYLRQAQRLTAPGNGGWGLTPVYQGSPLDTALVLLACAEAGGALDVAAALGYLKTAQLTGTERGWALAQQGSSDPAVTATVTRALARFRALDPTLARPVADGLATLLASVPADGPAAVQALAALAALEAGDASAAAPFLATLAATQGPDGSWGAAVYATALAIRALAQADPRLAESPIAVYVPDASLRAAVNRALGRGAMDSLDRGAMAGLTGLSAAGIGLSDLTGLEWALNLRSADLRYNRITDAAPLAGLSLTSLRLEGNPVHPGSAGDITGDGTVDVADVALLGRHLLGLTTVAAERLPFADVAPEAMPDGAVDLADLDRVTRMVLAGD